jgi:hypothetical protein
MTARNALRFVALAAVPLAAGACASDNVPATDVVYAVSVGGSPPLPADAAPAAPRPVQRASEAQARAWFDAHRPQPGYLPSWDTGAVADAGGGGCGDGVGLWGPSISLGLGFGWGHDGSGFGISLGLPLGFYVW